MATLSKHARSPHSPSPIYGIRPGFTVGDLEAARLTSLHVYRTWTAPGTNSEGEPTQVWNTVTGRWDVMDLIETQATTSDASGTVVSPHARVVKVSINVSGSGSVDVSFKSASDSYSAKIFDSGVLNAGTYEFFVGGYASPSSDGSSYVATQYTPGGPTTGDAQDQAGFPLSPGQDNNYVGGTYNPFQFLSLDGYDLKFFSTVVGSVGYDVSVTQVS